MSVALRYNLTDVCGNARPFCSSCTNSFSLTPCYPTCTDGPSEICLTPKKFRSGINRICGLPIDPDDPEAELPDTVLFRFTEGLRLCNGPSGGIGPCDDFGIPCAQPTCLPPDYDIPLFATDQLDLIQGTVPSLIPALCDGSWLCYESDIFNWPGPADEAHQCFTGQCRLTYYIITNPCLKNTFDDDSFLGCGGKIIILTLLGDGAESYDYGFGPLPCGGSLGGEYQLWTDEGVEWGSHPGPTVVPTSSISMVSVFDPCYTVAGVAGLCGPGGTPDMDYYGYLLGGTCAGDGPAGCGNFVVPWAVGLFRFNIRIPE